VLVFGCGYRRIADTSCSATTLRRRRDEWITAGVADQLRLLVLAAYNRMLGLELAHLAVDGCITKAPGGGQVAGPSPVDRRKQGLKRSIAVEAGGIPLAALPAPASHRDDGLLAATLDAIGTAGQLPAQPVVHLDAGYDYQPCRQVLAERGMVAEVAARGVSAPVQVGRRWVIERTHAWGNLYGKLRWCTERRRLVVEFWLALASAVIVCGRLVRRAWTTTAGRVAHVDAHDRLAAQALSELRVLVLQAMVRVVRSMPSLMRRAGRPAVPAGHRPCARGPSTAHARAISGIESSAGGRQPCAHLLGGLTLDHSA
jgi:hypothetical protein